MMPTRDATMPAMPTWATVQSLPGISRSAASLVLALAAVALLAPGCDGRRRDWDSCYTQPCADGAYCNGSHHCVPLPTRLDAGVLDAGGRPDLGPMADGLDGAKSDQVGDVPQAGDVDAAVDAAMDAESDVAIMDAPRGGEVAIDRAVDTFAPDAPGTCAADGDCLNPGLPFCADQVCVACKTAAQCPAATPICSAAHTCVSCAAVDAGCSSPTPVCEARSGRCLECLGDGDCAASPEKSFCVAGACAGCSAAVTDACATRDPSKPACVAAGVCVECASSADCAVASKPICDTVAHLCKPCSADGECEALAIGPGVCMAQQDGHCATDAETLYVGSRPGAQCSDAGAAGSAATPYCTLQLAVMAANARAIPLLVLSGALTGGFTGVALSAPLTVVGKGAVITPAAGSDGIGIVAGDLTLRGIAVRGSAASPNGIGINAAVTSGNTLVVRMDTCAVTDNPGGGIFLNGAGFVIKNTTVSRNGPNPTVWGGIAVQNPPAAGPTTLSQVTISDNKQAGLVCSASLAAGNAGSGVLATDNVGGINISSLCGVSSCSAGSAGCGAQSMP
jgi:hypothetical protein